MKPTHVKHILVLSDGETWETWGPAGGAYIYTITEEEYEQLCEGTIEPCDTEPSAVVRVGPFEANHG